MALRARLRESVNSLRLGGPGSLLARRASLAEGRRASALSVHHRISGMEYLVPQSGITMVFERRYIPTGGVSLIRRTAAGTSQSRALPAARFGALGTSPDFRNGVFSSRVGAFLEAMRPDLPNDAGAGTRRTAGRPALHLA
jgi:hypothetical protein